MLTFFFSESYKRRVLIGLLVDHGCSLKGLVIWPELPVVPVLLPESTLLISPEKSMR